MKKITIFIFLSVLLLSPAFAYNLNGVMTPEGNGTYSVTLENNHGHEYSGKAIKQADGSLEINVEDYNGQSYSGTAINHSNGEYELDLQNDSSGGEASGILSLNH